MTRVRALLVPFACAAALLLWAPEPARAHPHVFVAVKTIVLFGPDGKISGVRHSWTFDDMYSAFATQGLGGKSGKPSEGELTELAKVNVEQLEDASFFTFARAGGRRSNLRRLSIIRSRSIPKSS